MTVSRARLGVIFLTVLIVLIGFGIVLPILPYFAQRLGAGGLGVGVLFGVFSGMQFLSTAFLGRWSDSVGRRPVLLITMMINAAGYLLFAFAGSYPLLLAARVVSGLASGNISVAQAYIADISTPAERSKAMGIIGAAFGLGMVTGPALGGLAADAWGHSAPGLLAAALSVVNLVLAWRILPESLHEQHRRRHDLMDFSHIGDALKDARLQMLLLVWLVVPFAFTGFTTIMPLHMGAAFGWQARELGIAFVVIGVTAAVVQGWAFGRLARRFGDHALLIAGAAGMAVTIAVTPLFPSATMITLWMGAIAGANSLFAPSATGMVSILADPSEQGAVLGAAQALAALGRLAGPAVYGWSFDRVSAPTAYLLVGVVMLLGGIMALRVPKGSVLHKEAATPVA